MRWKKKDVEAPAPKYPGVPAMLDGRSAAIEMACAAADAVIAAAATPAADSGDDVRTALAGKATNASARRLLVFHPESDASAAATASGLGVAGLRAATVASGSGAFLAPALAAAAGKRLPWVLHLASRSMTRQAATSGAGHDDYHALDASSAFQLFARNAQEVADLALIAHRVAELALTPGVVAQDGGTAALAVETLRVPEPALVREFLGEASDLIDAPTPAQRLVYGDRRRRVPESFDLDAPAAIGGVQERDSYAQAVAAQRPFFLDHVSELADRACEEYAALTGRRYARCTAYRVDDAEAVVVAQGAVVADAEVACDWLRAHRNVRVGVVGVTAFRPFPADLLTAFLRGKRHALVLDRADQPLATDPPLQREVRAALGRAAETWRVRTDVPELYSASFGLGGRDVRPADLVGAVDAMRAAGDARRRVYLGIDFVRKDTRLPKLQLWQEQLLESYPDLATLAVAPARDVDVVPEGSLAVRLHTVGGGAGIAAAALARIAASVLERTARAIPASARETTGHPFTVDCVFAREPIRATAAPAQVDVALVTGRAALGGPDPFAGVAAGGIIVIGTADRDAAVWQSLPVTARRTILAKRLRVFVLDAAAVAREEVASPVMRGIAERVAFAGALLRVAPGATGTDAARITRAARVELASTLGDAGERVVARGFADVREVDLAGCEAPVDTAPVPARPADLDVPRARAGLANPGRFWEQVGYLASTGQDGIADPFVATGALPALTSAIRDLTSMRSEVPELVAARCTGCGVCWTQCPDAALAGVVTPLEDVLNAAMAAASGGRSPDRLRQIVKHVAAESRRLLMDRASTPIAEVFAAAYGTVVGKLGWEGERRAAADTEWAAVHAALAEFPLVSTAAFFGDLEAQSGGGRGRRSRGENPDTCKGCNVCVDVCPEDALRAIPQTTEVANRMRRAWRVWRELPETPDRYVDAASRNEGVGELAGLLLRKSSWASVGGGDAACPGCGEKTALHLVLSTVGAVLRPRVAAHVARLDGLIARLDEKARAILASDADLGQVARRNGGHVEVPLANDKRAHVERLGRVVHDLRDLRARYEDGAGGRSRAVAGIANATGCSAMWGSAYPLNPFPIPWVGALAGDAPAVAVGLFEATMRKMAVGFAAVRRAELEAADAYDAAEHEPALRALDWRDFDADEWALCPPILAVGGDGPMLDAGLGSLSRLLATDRPIRVVVLDTERASGTDARETRRELALLAIAHRNAFVLQSSAASPAHLLGGLLRGLASRHPAVFTLYAPCPRDHGIPATRSARAARLAIESRAFPLLVYDPAAGPGLGDRLSLDGNPARDEAWMTYALDGVDADGAAQSMKRPLTIADWATGEERFRAHFTAVAADAELVPFADYLALGLDDRAGKTPFVWTLGPDRQPGRLAVGDTIVRLAEDRARLWALLRQMAGLKQSGEIALEADFARRTAALTASYEAKLTDLRTRYPRLIARRLAERLLGTSRGGELLARAQAAPEGGNGAAKSTVAPAPAAAAPATVVEAAAPAVAAAPEAVLTLEASIDTALCTACNECTNLNKRMFAYNDKKQAYVKDVRAGTFKQLVQAAEKCPVHIIHPGAPVDAAEKDLDKWIERAKPFN